VRNGSLFTLGSKAHLARAAASTDRAITAGSQKGSSKKIEMNYPTNPFRARAETKKPPMSARSRPDKEKDDIEVITPEHDRRAL